MPFPATEKWIPLGPAQVTIGTVTIEKSNNVVIRDTVVKEDILYDEDGAVAANRVNVGDDVMVTIDVAMDAWEDLATLIPTLYSEGTAPNEIIARKSNIGEEDANITQLMTIKPYVGGVPTSSAYKTFTFPKVAVTQVAEVQYAARGQRFMRLECRAYKDTQGRFWYLGTPA